MPGALALLLSAAATTAVPSHVRPLLDVVITIEAGVVSSDADLRLVADGVRQIWRPAADVRLRRTGDLPGPVGGERIQLILTTRVRRTSGPALGWVEFVDGTPQPTITVSVTEIAALMRGGHWQGRALETLPGAVRQQFTRRALTCAVAHEIGHYLLRSSAHSKHGLMQANFGVDDIMDSSPSVARLSADEIDRVIQRQATAVARATVGE